MLIGGSPCFTKGPNVLTVDGYKDISEITTEDTVVSHDGSVNKVNMIGNKLSSIIKFRCQGSLPVKTTKNHPYYSGVMGADKKISSVKFREIKDLSKGMYVGMQINSNSEDIYNLSNDELYVIGRYIADGHTRKDYKKSGARYYQLILSVGNSKISDFNNIKLHYSCYNHTKSTYRIVFSNKRLVDIVEKECGSGALNKIISYNLLNLPKDKLSVLLTGYLDGDGCITNGTHKCTTISRKLAESLCLVIA